MGAQAESKMSRDIRAAVAAIGGDGFKNYGCIYSKAGVPDLTLIYKGRVVLCEVKDDPPTTLQGRPKKLQRQRMINWIAAGGESCCIRCVEDAIHMYTDPNAMIVDREVWYPHKREVYSHYKYINTDAKWIEYIEITKKEA